MKETYGKKSLMVKMQFCSGAKKCLTVSVIKWSYFAASMFCVTSSSLTYMVSLQPQVTCCDTISVGEERTTHNRPVLHVAFSRYTHTAAQWASTLEDSVFRSLIFEQWQQLVSHGSHDFLNVALWTVAVSFVPKQYTHTDATVDWVSSRSPF